LPSRPAGRASSRDRIEGLLALDGDWPYIWIDATYVKVRRNVSIVSVAVIIAVGVNTDGRRPPRSPGHVSSRGRIEGLLVFDGIDLAISDALEGIKVAVSWVQVDLIVARWWQPARISHSWLQCRSSSNTRSGSRVRR
jgi:hypothetical protein